MADYHIQTEPVCSHGSADLTTPPVSRGFRSSTGEIREQLGIPAGAKVLMITMGGVSGQYDFLGRLAELSDTYFIVPGIDNTRVSGGNLVPIPYESSLFHPDLVNSSDAVIGKLGYSTVAEVYYAGIPFGYILRSRFRESAPLAEYVMQHMKGFAINEREFHDGAWLSRIDDLLEGQRVQRGNTNGAIEVAHFICKLLK
jgi:UDP-N-acetylglucosamine:LPS N-acetylglucosamine transferase